MQGLVDYGSDSEDDATPAVTAAVTATAPTPSSIPSTSSSFLNLPPPKASSSSSSLSLPPPKTTSTPSLPPPKLPAKRAKGPVRIVLDLPSASSSSASTTEGEDGPSAGKKPKLSLGGGGGKLTGLAAMLPKPKNESVQVRLEKALAPTVTQSEEEGGEEVKKAGGPAFVPYSIGKGKAKAAAAAVKAAPPAEDFFGLGNVALVSLFIQSLNSLTPLSSGVVSSAPTITTTTKKPSSAISISSAPTLRSPSPPPPPQPTASDPYPGFVQLPSGDWVAKDQATYDKWMAHAAASSSSEAPKGFEEKDVVGAGGMMDMDEEMRKREAWSKRPEIIGGRAGEGEETKPKAVRFLAFSFLLPSLDHFLSRCLTNVHSCTNVTFHHTPSLARAGT